jgi:hypothetical protein
MEEQDTKESLMRGYQNLVAAVRSSHIPVVSCGVPLGASSRCQNSLPRVARETANVNGLVHIVRQMAEAVKYLHSLSIVHRQRLRLIVVPGLFI